MKLKSYLMGSWVEGRGPGIVVRDAVYGHPLIEVDSSGISWEDVARYAREVGGPRLRALTFRERGRRLGELARYLNARKETFYALSAQAGATRRDSWFDVDGGIGALFSYASLARRELPESRFWFEDAPLPLSKDQTFWGRHLLSPKRGLALHINAFNFPVWGMLEKLAPNLLAGVPAIVKPATPTAYVAQAVFQAIVESELFPEGSLQLVCGGLGDLFEKLGEQDVVTFTGSAATGQRLREHPNLRAHNIPFNMEADSLNAALLGASVRPEDPEFELFLQEVLTEQVVKAGQKCTAIRRAFVPQAHLDRVAEALAERLKRLSLGDPTREDVEMGPLVSREQRDEVRRVVQELAEVDELVLAEGTPELKGGSWEEGGFMAPVLLLSPDPWRSRAHDLEPFGPVVTLMPYRSLEEAAELIRRGRGSLAATLVSHDREELRFLVDEIASSHGRILILNRENAASSTGHGAPLPPLVHGGPGRAGGGEELGGLRGITRYLQRVALQVDPTTLSQLSEEYIPGAQRSESQVHPFRKYFEELSIGESLLTHRRTVTEADIVNFANLSGDHFYAHTDEIGARDSLFGRRVAHGYFLVSAAAGLFVDPAPGPVLANYGLERLRFLKPVGIGDTLQARLIVARKLPRETRPGEIPAGVVEWDVELLNQGGELVATYRVLTLVRRKPEAPSEPPS